MPSSASSTEVPVARGCAAHQRRPLRLLVLLPPCHAAARLPGGGGAGASCGRRVPIAIVGGNHDRWGDDFWERDLGALYHPRELRFEVGTPRHAGHPWRRPHRHAPHRRACSTPILGSDTALAAFRLLHPDRPTGWCCGMQPMMGENDRGSSARAQGLCAAGSLGRARASRESPTSGLVIMAHTHHAAVRAAVARPAVPQSGRLVRRLPLCRRHRDRRGAPAASRAEVHHLGLGEPVAEEASAPPRGSAARRRSPRSDGSATAPAGASIPRSSQRLRQRARRLGGAVDERRRRVPSPGAAAA